MYEAIQSIIELGKDLEKQQDEAFMLWTWLPSHKEARKYHGDHSDNFTPSVEDIIKEACMFISHGLNPTDEQYEEAGEFYKCPCGKDHEKTHSYICTYK